MNLAEEIEDPTSEAVQRTTRIAQTAASRSHGSGRNARSASLTSRARRPTGCRHEWDAQKTAARAELGMANDRWFERATPRETANFWQSAQVWVRVEPDDFGVEEARIRAEIERRYDTDLVDVDREGRELADELRELADAQRRREREFECETAADQAGVGVVVVGAGQDAALDRAESERHEAARSGSMANDLGAQTDGVEYDSDARRAALAERARAGGSDAETINARVKASNVNGRPSRHAGARSKRVATPGRPPAQASKGVEVQR